MVRIATSVPLLAVAELAVPVNELELWSTLGSRETILMSSHDHNVRRNSSEYHASILIPRLQSSAASRRRQMRFPSEAKLSHLSNVAESELRHSTPVFWHNIIDRDFQD